MIALLLSGREEFWHAYVAVALTGLAWALDMPSRRSLIHDLFGRASLTNAMALDSVAMHSSRMVGPIVAGGMIAAVSVSGGYAVIALFYAASILFTSRVTPPASRTGLQAAGSIARNLAEALSYVLVNRVILATVVVTVLMGILLLPYMQMIPVIARDSLGVGPGLMGLLVGADGLGAIVGSMAIASVAEIKYHGRVFLAGSAVALVMSIGFALSGSFSTALPILVLLGVGHAGFGAMMWTIILLAPRAEMRGRALGVISLANGAAPLGALLIGALASATGPELAIIVLSTVGLLAIALVTVLMPQLRDRIVPPREAEPRDAGPVRDAPRPLAG
jgi:MFS family permease